MEKNLNIGTFEVLPKNKSYSNLLEFLDDYKRNELNAEGLRIANYRESSYLIREFKTLGISEILKKYYYNFVSEIVLSIQIEDWKGREVIIDDPLEVIKFQNGEDAYGYDSDGSEYEISKESYDVMDWNEESSIYFVVRPL